MDAWVRFMRLTSVSLAKVQAPGTFPARQFAGHFLTHLAVLQVPAGFVRQVSQPGAPALVVVFQCHRPVVAHLTFCGADLELHRRLSFNFTHRGYLIPLTGSSGIHFVFIRKW
jgi:hypothetical protein